MRNNLSDFVSSHMACLHGPYIMMVARLYGAARPDFDSVLVLNKISRKPPLVFIVLSEPSSIKGSTDVKTRSWEIELQ